MIAIAVAVPVTVIVRADRTPATVHPSPTLVDSVLSTGAGRLYAIVRECAPAPSGQSGIDPCAPMLRASTDNGGTWEVRGDPLTGYGGFNALGPDLLEMARFRYAPDASMVIANEVSVDGGRTWRPRVVSPEPIGAVPSGAVPFCLPEEHTPEVSSCELGVLDPVAVVMRPLPAQPALRPYWMEVATDGRWWVGGVSGPQDRAAVATSVDRGRTWTVSVLPGVPVPPESPDGLEPADPPDWYRPKVLPGAVAGLAYVQVGGGAHPIVLRTVDGGRSWTDADPGRTLGLGEDSCLVSTDGVHVVGPSGYGQPGFGWRANRDGTGYRPATLVGLPQEATLSGWLPDRYVAHTSDQVYVSDDGWNWRQVW